MDRSCPPPFLSFALALGLLAAVPASPAAAAKPFKPIHLSKKTPISEKYAALGGSTGQLGSPVTAESKAPDGIGRYRHYEKGSIYWSPATGAHEVHGLIRKRWADEGWEKGWLGYPLTDEIDTYDREGRVTKFEGGELIWRRATDAVSEVRATDLLVDLPTAKGEKWKVVQANAVAPDDSHAGRWVYCYDMVKDGSSAATRGRPIVSPATAKVAWVEDNNLETPSNVVAVRLGQGRYASLLHTQQGGWSALQSTGPLNLLPSVQPWSDRPVVASGKPVAKAGATGTEGDHLHFCVTTSPDVSAFGPFESVPFRFRDFDLSKDGGKTWSVVAVGVPRKGDWVRRRSATGSPPKVNFGVDVLNFGKVKGSVSMPPGIKATAGSTIKINALSKWGEPVATATLTVPTVNLTGPYPYVLDGVPNYPGIKIEARYSGKTSPNATGVAGSSSAVSVKANATQTRNVSMNKTTVK